MIPLVFVAAGDHDGAVVVFQIFEPRSVAVRVTVFVAPVPVSARATIGA